jgi:hypothetical protein
MTYDTQPIADAAGEAFNAALDGGSSPADAFEAGAEAATQMMGDMGAPPAMIDEVVSEARSDYDQGISDGMPPGEAFEAIDAEGLGPDMGAIADAAHTAFEEAIEGGASPADAFEAAATAAGEECANQDIPPEMHQEATATLRTEFNEAIESGADPMEAFDALEPPGMDEGMGSEYAGYEGPPPGAEGGQEGSMDGGQGGGEGYATYDGPPPVTDGEGNTSYADQGGQGGQGGGEGYATYDGPPPVTDGEGNTSYADQGGQGGEGYASPPPDGGMDSLEAAMGGGDDYAAPPPTDAGDAAMDSAMTQSANEEYAPPPTDTGGGQDYAAPPPPDAGGGEDYAAPPPPDDPGAIG